MENSLTGITLELVSHEKDRRFSERLRNEASSISSFSSGCRTFIPDTATKSNIVLETAEFLCTRSVRRSSQRCNSTRKWQSRGSSLVLLHSLSCLSLCRLQETPEHPPLTPISPGKDVVRFIHSSFEKCTNDVIYLSVLKRLRGLNTWVLASSEVSVFVSVQTYTGARMGTSCKGNVMIAMGTILLEALD